MTRRKVLWSRSARRDLEAIILYLAEHSPEAARATLQGLETRAGTLSTLAHRGRIVPELARLHIRGYRELVIPPHRIVYRIHEPAVLVLAVLDARRSLEDVLLERLYEVEPGEP